MQDEPRIPDASNRKMEHSGVEDGARQAGKVEVVRSFTDGIVHDLNNILTVIVGCSQLLLEHPQLGQLAGPRIEQILNAGFRAAKLTGQLLAYSRNHSARRVPLNLSRMVTESKGMIHSLIGEDIELKTEFAPDLWNITAEPEQMKQVLLDFCVHAREAMQDGSAILIRCQNVTIQGEEPAVQGFALRPGRYVRLAVSSAGVDGQPPAQISESCFSSGTSCCKKGLGLAAVHYIMKQGGGCVWAESQPQKGSCLSVYLPATGEAAAAQKSNPELPHAGGSETLLLVGTPSSLRPFLPQLLENLGYTVLEAEDVEDAELMIERHKDISALLIDNGLPGTSGLALAASARKVHPRLKVLQVIPPTSGFVNHPLPGEGSDYVRKPFTPAVLARKLRVLLDGDKRNN